MSEEESSDVASDSDLSDAGEDWDELEKKAIEEDRKQAIPKQAGRQPAPAKRRR